ncbi:energy-coupled thiamine transporter ThiT [Fictibacillus sp. 18YEL24]|uniref:energy-coupled thiamine transporter ThiT n=1 Tax=Fictibacillus sp. 18YEL24 TaxID=2745875 RepID=UPI0018CCBAD4|nr:energy-coupled thiamine transporter ThiT [Fictibacillus sp. 18YEL24]MBH0167686.1 energy-coupled thiamine transporter ThiT [Fictibacillus sp. 18YEL24]
MNNGKVLLMAEIAIMAALSLILGLISFKGIWPQGGSVSLEMVPIFLLAFRRGLKAGVFTGLVVGLLQLLINPQIYYFAQVILDYPLAFALAGVAGAFAPSLAQNKSKRTALMVLGIFVGCTLRLISHVLSGVIFFSEFAPKEMNVWLYSFLYNGSFMVVIFAITALVVILLTNTAPKLLHAARNGHHQAA